MATIQAPHESRTRFLDAAMHVFRAKGYTATRIEDVCEAAGLSKGSFFHHFKTKEDLALAAADHFAAMADRVFESAPFRDESDPLDRVLGYIDLRAAMLQGELPDYTCLLGTMVQEVYDTHPTIRVACERNISAHAATVAVDIAAAKQLYAPNATWTPESVALYTQAVIQGAFILAKAKQDARIAADCIGHLRQYLQTLFNPTSYQGA